MDMCCDLFITTEYLATHIFLLSIQVQFDEHEDEKVCTIELHDDKVFEGEEQFTVQLAMPSYALLGELIIQIDQES